MSLLDKVAQKGTGAKSETFFAELISVNLDPGAGKEPYMTVQHYRTGEVLNVALNPGSNITNLSEGKARPQIVDFTKGKMKTEQRAPDGSKPGGTVRIEGAFYYGKEGIWKARWITGALHTHDEGRVYRMENARVSPLIAHGEKTFRVLSALDAGNAVTVTGAEQFSQAVEAALVSHGNAVVRLFNADGKVSGFSLGLKPQDGVAPETLAAAAVAGNEKVQKYVEALGEGLLAPNETLQVVPQFTLFFGGDAKNHRKLDAIFTEKKTTGTGEEYQASRGYTSVLVTTQFHEGSTDEFVTSVIPETAFAKFSAFGTLDAVTSAPPPAPSAPAEAVSSEMDMDDLPPEMDLGALAEEGGGQATSTARFARPSSLGMG
jgi:hypothetical protein